MIRISHIRLSAFALRFSCARRSRFAMPDHSGKSGGASTTMVSAPACVAAMQFGIQRPRKRLLRHAVLDLDVGRPETGGDFRVRNDETGGGRSVAHVPLLQFRVILPVEHK